MKRIIDIDEEDYHRIASGFGQEEDALLLEKILKNSTPYETVTEFADRCRECGREKILDKIMDEVFDIDDEIVLNPDSVYERKAYVRLGNVMDIINKYKAESKVEI